jgi:UDP-N-acetylmuramyl pentapeptide phosphotransferase/UDP-N-acetylglucosamine-1-phosphate transferase
MKELEWLLLASILLSWLVASMVLRWAEHWQLVQSPNHRSSQVLPTPNGGGLGIVVAYAPMVAGVAASGAGRPNVA